MKNIFALIFTLLLLSGCASAIKKYEKMSTEPISASSVSNAATSISATQLSLDNEIKVDLKKGLPILQAEGFRSYYEVFEFDAKAGETYKITANSLCACFGFTKLIMVPVGQVFGPEGELVLSAPQKVELLRANWDHPARAVSYFEFSPEFDGKHRFILYGDNSIPGKVIGTDTGVGANGYIVLTVQVKLQSGPDGKVLVKLTNKSG